MASRLVEIEIPDVGIVYMKVQDDSILQDVGKRIDINELKKRVTSSFADALVMIETLSVGIYKKMKSISKEISPDEFGVEFGVNIDSEVGAVFATSSIGATIKIELKWTKESK